MSNVDRIIEYEEDGLDEAEEIAMFQEAINSGMAWKLQGSYGRAAMGYIEAGLCMLGEEGHHDAYGNYVPSRTEVQAGTKGSPEFVEAHRE
jgi:hypothetical protein